MTSRASAQLRKVAFTGRVLRCGLITVSTEEQYALEAHAILSTGNGHGAGVKAIARADTSQAIPPMPWRRHGAASVMTGLRVASAKQSHGLEPTLHCEPVRQVSAN
jgi:hypothetical protein